MPAYRSSVTFRDSKGETAKTGFYTLADNLADASVAAAVTAPLVEALSVASLASVHGPAETPPTAITYGGAGVYDDVEDKAELAFTDAAGAVHRYQFPAPPAAIFLADNDTVNPAAAAVAALIANFIGGTVCSRSSVVMTGYLGGIRIRRRTQRRFNLITKNPALTGPGL